MNENDIFFEENVYLFYKYLNYRAHRALEKYVGCRVQEKRDGGRNKK